MILSINKVELFLGGVHFFAYNKAEPFLGGVHFLPTGVRVQNFSCRSRSVIVFPTRGLVLTPSACPVFPLPFLGCSLDWAWYAYGIGAHTVPEHRVLWLDLVITPFSWSPLPSPCFFSVFLYYVVQ